MLSNPEGGDSNILRGNGFTEGEMKRLGEVRRGYYAREKLQNLAELRRLEFVRWLVSTGRLPRENIADGSRMPGPEQKWPQPPGGNTQNGERR